MPVTPIQSSLQKITLYIIAPAPASQIIDVHVLVDLHVENVLGHLVIEPFLPLLLADPDELPQHAQPALPHPLQAHVEVLGCADQTVVVVEGLLGDADNAGSLVQVVQSLPCAVVGVVEPAPQLDRLQGLDDGPLLYLFVLGGRPAGIGLLRVPICDLVHDACGALPYIDLYAVIDYGAVMDAHLVLERVDAEEDVPFVVEISLEQLRALDIEDAVARVIHGLVQPQLPALGKVPDGIGQASGSVLGLVHEDDGQVDVPGLFFLRYHGQILYSLLEYFLQKQIARQTVCDAAAGRLLHASGPGEGRHRSMSHQRRQINIWEISTCAFVMAVYGPSQPISAHLGHRSRVMGFIYNQPPSWHRPRIARNVDSRWYQIRMVYL